MTNKPSNYDMLQDARPLNEIPKAAESVDMGSQVIINVANPSAPTDAANRLYVDNIAIGLAWRPPVRLFDATHTTKPTGDPVTIDTKTVLPGDRVLFVFLSVAGDNNRAYKAVGTGTNITGWTLELDGKAGDGSPSDGDALFVKDGSAYTDQGWTYNGGSWVQFTGLGSITVGAGLTKVLNEIKIGQGDGIYLTAGPTGTTAVNITGTTGLQFIGVSPLTALGVKVDGTTIGINLSNQLYSLVTCQWTRGTGEIHPVTADDSVLPNRSGAAGSNLGSALLPFRHLYLAEDPSGGQTHTLAYESGILTLGSNTAHTILNITSGSATLKIWTDNTDCMIDAQNHKLILSHNGTSNGMVSIESDRVYVKQNLLPYTTDTYDIGLVDGVTPANTRRFKDAYFSGTIQVASYGKYSGLNAVVGSGPHIHSVTEAGPIYFGLYGGAGTAYGIMKQTAASSGAFEFYPSITTNGNLGNSTYRWGALYGTSIDVTGSITLGSTITMTATVGGHSEINLGGGSGGSSGNHIYSELTTPATVEVRLHESDTNNYHIFKVTMPGGATNIFKAVGWNGGGWTELWGPIQPVSGIVNPDISGWRNIDGITGNIVPSTDGTTSDIGSSSLRFKTLWLKGAIGDATHRTSGIYTNAIDIRNATYPTEQFTIDTAYDGTVSLRITNVGRSKYIELPQTADTFRLKTTDSNCVLYLNNTGTADNCYIMRSSNTFQITSPGDVLIYRGGSSLIFNATSASITLGNHVYPNGDASYDFGVGGGSPSRWRNLYLSGTAYAGGLSLSGSITLEADTYNIGDATHRVATLYNKVLNSGDVDFQIVANTKRLYVKNYLSGTAIAGSDGYLALGGSSSDTIQLLAGNIVKFSSNSVTIGEVTVNKRIDAIYVETLQAYTRITAKSSDLFIDAAANGIVLKDTQGTPHYWRVQVDNSGNITTADLGTTYP